jgi:GT2 family glycosyltransferase
MPFVDVVIVNYDSGPHLARSVDALQRQTFVDFRIIVVDNASRDGSAEGLAQGRVPLEVLRPGENLGFAGANNLALRARVTAPWAALLNPDAFPQPDWLEKLVAAARRHPSCFFGCKMLDASDPARIDGVGDAYHVSGLHWRIGHGGSDLPCYAQSREIFGPCAAAALYRTSDLLEAGGFDEDFFCYAEDVDLAFRLRLLGRRCWYVPDAVVEHMGSATTGRRSDFTLYHGHRNLVWCYVKNMPAPLFWLYLPQHLALNLATLLWFALRGRAGVISRAKRDALRGLPRAWRKRRSIQAGRRAHWREIIAVMARGLPIRRKWPYGNSRPTVGPSVADVSRG